MSFNNPNLMCIDVDDVAYCEYTFVVIHGLHLVIIVILVLYNILVLTKN